MLRKVNKSIGLKSPQKTSNKLSTSKKQEQLEIDFGDFFKPKKLIVKKQKPEEKISIIISDYLKSLDKTKILNDFLLYEINLAKRERKLGKLELLEKTSLYLEEIKKNKEHINWAEQQQKRHRQDPELTKELNEDISKYKDEIYRLEKKAIVSISSMFKLSYSKNFIADNIESVILRNYYLKNNNILYKKYNIIPE